MSLEIERKFLVKGDFKPFSHKQERVRQAYLSVAPEHTVRVRQKGQKGYLTIKGKTSPDGVSRFEWEKEISPGDVTELLTLCNPDHVIDKTRYYVGFKGFIFEVDEFYGSNEGLVVAELELPSPGTVFEKPDWLGTEVTGIEKYYNSRLSLHPYSKWEEESKK